MGGSITLTEQGGGEKSHTRSHLRDMLFGDDKSPLSVVEPVMRALQR